MYANRFAADRGFRPGSMTLALVMTVLPIAGLVISTHASSIVRILDRPIEVRNIPLPKDPPPDPKPRPKTADPIRQQVYRPPVDLPPLSDRPRLDTTTKLADPPPPIPSGTGTVGTLPPVAKPIVVGTSYDQRFAYALQPPYPPSEIRSGNSGRVALRLLIGTDGRVKQVEKIAAASDAFFAAAQRQALTKWRFKPATSDGVAIEQWTTMSLRFVLQDE